MGKNEIKLRRQPLNPADILRHHNYPALLKKHARTRQIKRAVRFFTFSLIITIVVLMLLMIISYVWFRVDKTSQELKRGHEMSISDPLREFQPLRRGGAKV